MKQLEEITQLLSHGEQILWASSSVPGEFMDSDNKARNIRWFIGVAAAFAVLMLLYTRAVVQAGTNAFNVVTGLIVILSAVIFLDPICTYRKLQKVEYIITNKRVLVYCSSSSNFSLPIAKASPVRVLDDGNGYTTLVIGPEAGAGRPERLRSYGVVGRAVTEGESNTRYPVLYHVADADKALAILESTAG
jgi:hypothetical protein